MSSGTAAACMAAHTWQHITKKYCHNPSHWIGMLAQLSTVVPNQVLPYYFLHADCKLNHCPTFLCCSNSLKEGFYTYTVEGSIWGPNSHFDNLVSVSGVDVYSQKDTTYISVQADGSSQDTISLFTGFKGAGWVLPEYNQSRIGIQRYETWLQSFEGPDPPLTLGSKATFTWAFSGLGNTTCEINGVNTNPSTGICTSPLVYTIATTLNQTLVLKYTDVCAVTHTASMTFGGFGWEVSGGVNELGSSGVLASGTSDVSLRKSSRARRLTGGLRAVVIGSMVAVVLMVMLL
eukprot:GHUV01032137.1.p1 GENE.GHUV01032137.1~~GHUV01032137.1.p1  ORF type:complete len:290 (+),score=20.59 GHUV01032137.1:79-948(+)